MTFELVKVNIKGWSLAAASGSVKRIFERVWLRGLGVFATDAGIQNFALRHLSPSYNSYFYQNDTTDTKRAT